MPSDYLSGIQVGAQVGNMMAQRQERLMELRSQEALRAVQERHLAAQTDALVNELRVKQADEAKDDADMQIYNQLHHTITETGDFPPGTPPDEINAIATKQADQWVVNNNPRLAGKIGQARVAIAKPELAQQTLQTRENVAATQAGAKVEAAQIGVNAQKDYRDAQIQMLKSHADLYKAQALGQVGGRGAGSMDPAQKHATALRDTRRAIETAHDAGDDAGEAEATQMLSDMLGYMAKAHPDKSSIAKSQMLMTKYRETLRASLMDKRLKPEVDRIEKEITGGAAPAGDSSGDSENADESAPNTGKSRFVFDPKTGRVVKQPAKK